LQSCIIARSFRGATLQSCNIARSFRGATSSGKSTIIIYNAQRIFIKIFVSICLPDLNKSYTFAVEKKFSNFLMEK
jgi:hypothetical protein